MNRAPASVWRHPIHFLAFGLGSGAAPYAPGTVGTLAAIPLYLYLLEPLSLGVYGLVLGVSFLLGCWWCEQTSQDLGVHDHSGIVWDEFVGYWLTMWAAPPGWQWALFGALVFRFFDILKPWPIRWADRHLDGGFGIMFDDVLAGVYAWIVVAVCAWFF
ncbi:phosphatidylglycerophosphatase A [Allopseudospirillum japonicum]|uniref:Phosphatidylglycerophosphatase A n=1 Tax=Allopseudospirillum japonicum TaxID=64971 RepID=A0A1H6UIU6_9GAMM|nr:phosphatidylglycerophosphatase A [Allopseudospirillum japonicum]SEI88130.1 phosphatidylglycerophosphatase A [Allopseudospirillum japonicum]